MRKIAFVAATIIRFLVAPLIGLTLIVLFIIRLIKWSFSPWWFWPLGALIVVAINTLATIAIDLTQDEESDK